MKRMRSMPSISLTALMRSAKLWPAASLYESTFWPSSMISITPSAASPLISSHIALIILLFLAAAVYCGLSLDRVRVNSDLTAFLSPETETRQGLTVMEEEFVTYDNANISGQVEDLGFGVEGGRRPVFDLKIKSEKNSPFSRISQNELAKELYGLGVFNPQMADQALMLLDMMDFEGKDNLTKKISERGTIFDQMQQQIEALTQQVMLLGQGQVMPAGMNVDPAAGSEPVPQGAGGTTGKDPTRDAFQSYTNTLPNTAAERARNVNAVRS